MAKKTKLTLGSIYKGKKNEQTGVVGQDYMKLDGRSKQFLLDIIGNMDEKKGLVLNLDSKKNRLDSVNKAEAEGKLSEEIANKVREDIEKMPEYVRFNITYLAEKKD